MRDKYPHDWELRRQRAISRDGYACCNCGRSDDSGASLEVHHTVPVARGGSHNLAQLVTLCERCHLAAHHENHTAPNPVNSSRGRESERITVDFAEYRLACRLGNWDKKLDIWEKLLKIKPDDYDGRIFDLLPTVSSLERYQPHYRMMSGIGSPAAAEISTRVPSSKSEQRRWKNLSAKWREAHR